MTTAATIARALSERGYDFEIAHIFALEAMSRGRLATSQTLAEAAQTVADLICPTGVAFAQDRPPRRTDRPAGRQSEPSIRSDARTGSWLVT